MQLDIGVFTQMLWLTYRYIKSSSKTAACKPKPHPSPFSLVPVFHPGGDCADNSDRQQANQRLVKEVSVLAPEAIPPGPPLCDKAEQNFLKKNMA